MLYSLLFQFLFVFGELLFLKLNLCLDFALLKEALEIVGTFFQVFILFEHHVLVEFQLLNLVC